ncbi:MAG: hypothetical protein WCR42_03580 [bacterium]
MLNQASSRMMVIITFLLATLCLNSKPYEKYEDMLNDFKNLSIDESKVYTVSDFKLTREDAVFNFKSGTFYFCKPINGRSMGVVFIGDATFDFSPPTKAEVRQLERILNKDEVKAKSKAILLFFADNTADSIEKSCIKTTYKWDTKMKELVKRFVEYELDDRENNITYELAQTLLDDRTSEYFLALVTQANKEDLIYQIDPYQQEKVLLYRGVIGAYDNYYEVINQFSKKEDSLNKGVFYDKLFNISKYTINIDINKDIVYSALAMLDITVKDCNFTWIQFYLNEWLNIASVKLSDGTPLNFYKPERNHILWVKIPKAAEPFTPLKIILDYSGSFLNRVVDQTYMKSSTTWYPIMSDQPKIFFDMQVTYPLNYEFLGVGDLVSTEKTEFTNVSRWVTKEPVNTNSFSFGAYRKKEFKSPNGMDMGFYFFNYNFIDYICQESGSLIDFYSKLFGPIPYKKIYISEFPDNYGEAFPGLIHLSELNFEIINTESNNVSFFAQVFAHQWWGNDVLPETYHDNWIVDGLSAYSAMIYIIAIKKDPAKFFELLRKSQEELINARISLLNTGIRPGALSIGYRNVSSKAKGDYSLVMFAKGMWIFHMLRNLMMDFETRDETDFTTLLREIYTETDGSYISTAYLKQKVEDKMKEDMGWFFDQWVDDYKIPKYKFAYKFEKSLTGKYTVKCRVEQSEVPDSFKMYVPISIEISENNIIREKKLITGKTTEFEIQLADIKPKNIYFNDPSSVLCQVEYVGW